MDRTTGGWVLGRALSCQSTTLAFFLFTVMMLTIRFLTSRVEVRTVYRPKHLLPSFSNFEHASARGTLPDSHPILSFPKKRALVVEEEATATAIQTQNALETVVSGKVRTTNRTGGWCLTENQENQAKVECKNRDMLLVVMTMNRPWSLKRLIHSLDQATYDEHGGGGLVDLRVTVDRDHTGNVDAETMDFLNALQWKHGILEVHVWQEKVGLFGQWVDSWPAELYPENLYKAVILLEDDLEVSPHYAKWFIGAHESYGNITGVGAITGQRPILVAALNGPASLAEQVPSHVKAFGYLLMATWSLSPRHAVWRDFRKWVKDKRTNDPGFAPSVPGIVPNQWYEHFVTTGEQENMWEMWFIRFADERRLHTVYAWCEGGAKTIVGNWMEAGLHFSGEPVLDFPIATEWSGDLLAQHPLPLVGYDLLFQ